MTSSLGVSAFTETYQGRSRSVFYSAENIDTAPRQSLIKAALNKQLTQGSLHVADGTDGFPIRMWVNFGVNDVCDLRQGFSGNGTLRLIVFLKQVVSAFDS